MFTQKSDAIPYVRFAVDSALAPRDANGPFPDDARYVGYENNLYPGPVFVAVWNYLPGLRLHDDEAEEIARDFLAEVRDPLYRFMNARWVI